MSFNRLNYDENTYRTELKQSVGPSSYILSTPWRQCQPCLSTDVRQPTGQAVSTPVTKSMVDVNSDLIGITRKASRDPCSFYKPSTNIEYSATPVTLCTAGSRSEDTRLSNPPCTLRSTGFNRWEWLCKDPQERVEIPFDTFVNSQLLLKDNYRPVIPSPIDPRTSLPPDHDVEMPFGSQECPQVVKTNLPIVSWRDCNEIAQY